MADPSTTTTATAASPASPDAAPAPTPAPLAEGQGYSFSGSQLSVVGADLTSLPEHVCQQYAPHTTALDISYNKFVTLDQLPLFPRLESLTADNNALVASQPFAPNHNLQVLSVNNNDIDDLQVFLDSVVQCFPNITYLSMLKNPACPNPLIGKDQDEYRRYRLYVLYRLPGLKFLDSSKVAPAEKAEAKQKGEYLVAAKPSAREEPAERAHRSDLPAPLPSDTRQVGETRASFGRTRYVYYGKHSEGNRFILNSDL
eukprot:TRINITY_DN4389_c4_g1_i2.p1 TRINITY_DN4389_c4_g1~~TRINITY_DN4389_c4_g1_i2.p1  ORF type:complete len:272 (+),score=79.44 TRINITY_DN4389_c4_g1_i2:47-817(+)